MPFDTAICSDGNVIIISTESALSDGSSLHGHQDLAPKGSERVQT